MDAKFILQIVFLCCAHFIAGNQAAEHLGCYADDSVIRTLPHQLPESSDNTPSKCLNACIRSGYRLAGVQFGIGCYCGNTLPSTKITDDNCNKTCSGDPTVMCGGWSANNIYRSTQDHSAAHLGCYRKSHPPILPNYYSKLSENTPSKCITVCSEKGFQLAGVQVGHECFCGNTEPSTKKVLDENCNVPCIGDPDVMCGGRWGINIYSTGVTTSTVSTTTMSPQERVCRKIMDSNYLNVAETNGNTCQYRCINKISKKGISIYRMDGERCNTGNGQGLCVKGVCHENVHNSGCPLDYSGVRNICKMFCYGAQPCPGMSLVMNIPDREICIDEQEYHGTCANGKCVISLEGRN